MIYYFIKFQFEHIEKYFPYLEKLFRKEVDLGILHNDSKFKSLHLLSIDERKNLFSSEYINLPKKKTNWEKMDYFKGAKVTSMVAYS